MEGNAIRRVANGINVGQYRCLERVNAGVDRVASSGGVFGLKADWVIFVGMNDNDINVPTNPFSVVDRSPSEISGRPFFEDIGSRVVEDIAAHRGLIVILGEQGTGKTQLLHWIIKNLDPVYTRIPLHGAHLGAATEEAEKGKSNAAHTEHALHKWQVTRDFVITQASDGHEVVVLIDDAHALAPAIIDELVSMLHHESLPEQRVAIVLLGLPVLGERMSQSKFDDRAENSHVVYRLDQPEPIPVASFIEERMASADDTIAFPDETIDLIEHCSGGKPALVNTLCGWTFLLACRDGVSTVTNALVTEAAFRCGLLKTSSEGADLAPFPEGQLAVDFLRREHHVHREPSSVPATEAEDDTGNESVLVRLSKQVDRLNEPNANNEAEKSDVVPRLDHSRDNQASSFMEAAMAQYAVDFQHETIELIERYCGGKSALVRTLCGWAFLLAWRDGASTITSRLIHEAAVRSGLSKAPGKETDVVPCPRGQQAIEFLRRERSTRNEPPTQTASDVQDGLGNNASGHTRRELDTNNTKTIAERNTAHEALVNTDLGRDKTREHLHSFPAGRRARSRAEPMSWLARRLSKILSYLTSFVSRNSAADSDDNLYRPIDEQRETGRLFTIHRVAAGLLSLFLLGGVLLYFVYPHASQNDSDETSLEPSDFREFAPKLHDREGLSGDAMPLAKQESVTPDNTTGDVSERPTSPDLREQPHIEALLEKAQAQYEAKKLTMPAGDNALETYQTILSASPDFQPALDGIAKIRERYKRWAQAAQRESDLSKAEYFHKKALSLDSQSVLTKLR